MLFIKLHLNESMTQLYKLKVRSRSHFKAMEFCGGGYCCPSDCSLVNLTLNESDINDSFSFVLKNTCKFLPFLFFSLLF